MEQRRLGAAVPKERATLAKWRPLVRLHRFDQESLSKTGVIQVSDPTSSRFRPMQGRHPRLDPSQIRDPSGHLSQLKALASSQGHRY